EDRGPLPTFSAIFPSLPEPERRRIDERSFIDAVIGAGGIEPHFVRGDTLSPIAEIERLIAHQDEPVVAPNLYLHGAPYRVAAQNGVGAVLDGIAGDAVVSHGLERLPDLARSGRWRALGRELGALSR